MELNYPLKVLYTLGSSQLMLARADGVECRAVKPRPHSDAEAKHASTMLKTCLSALCTASPELLADPRTDHSVYALDPLQVPELMVGRGLLTWLMSESGRVVGTVKEDYVDGEDVEVLEVRLSLTPTVAVSRAQHATSLHNISHFHSSSANPSPPTTPLSQPTLVQSTRASVRTRTRTNKDKSTTPPLASKRGKQKSTRSESFQARSDSPASSRNHSRVSSISSLALSQTKAQSQPAQPPSSSQQDRQSSPTKSLARLLASVGSSSDPKSGTPLLDSLLERLKATGLLSTFQAGEAGLQDSEHGQSSPEAVVKLEDVSEAQRQVLLTLLKFATLGENGNESKRDAPHSIKSPASGVAPSPRVFAAPSPLSISAPSPATSVAIPQTPAPFASGDPGSKPPSSLGVRKRELDDGEIVEIDPSEYSTMQNDTKRVRVGDTRSASSRRLEFGNNAPSPSLSAPSPEQSVTGAPSPNPSIPSPNISAAVASPSVSVASPNVALPCLSPNISAASPNPPGASPAVSSTSPSITAASPALSNVSPAISAASPFPYPYPTPAGFPPRSLTTTISQPNLSFSQPPSLQPSLSQPNTSIDQAESSNGRSKKRTPRGALVVAQTDLPPCTGSFITPRDQIGQPRPPAEVPPPARKCVAGPGRSKGGAKGNRKPDAEEARRVSEEEVRGMLAGGYYPSGGLQDEHRRLFGAGGSRTRRPEAEAHEDKVEAEDTVRTDLPQAPPPAPHQDSNPASGSSAHYRSSSAAPVAAPRPRQPRAPTKTPRQRPPTIPKRSPVALPPVSRLPMMMTSPIRATGEPRSSSKSSDSRLPLSLSEYSPLKRLLQTAGVDKIEDVLGRDGVLGLKGGGWKNTLDALNRASRANGKAAMIKEQEREVVDLTSDADDEAEAPAPKTPPRPTSLNQAPPTTPPRRQSQYVAVTPPRKVHPTPLRVPDSPLFRESKVLEYPSSDAPDDQDAPDLQDIPLDLPPSSPPPMSDSDLDPEVGSGSKRHQEGSQGYQGSSGASRDVPSTDNETEDHDQVWDETIRPAEAPTESESGEPVGSILGDEQLGFLSGEVDMSLGALAGDTVVPLDIQALLDMLEAQQPSADGMVDMNSVLLGPEAQALDFSWLDGLGAGDGGIGGASLDMDFSSVDFLGGQPAGSEPPLDEASLGEAGPGSNAEAELAQLLAAFATG
ncbi:hypothetical protein CTheo_7759 [Ceratobasidium theobromae]|uniref:Ams2/SPT21 N-terminal domain-containing protein n=1 Tax=Ceratobasidium theobromae TaxID=1582974 RepID=A0A5N5QBK3_9AGAM|nr:hypothetical protein CTheo_7759 [Ceratobasidium theobromae]